MRFVDGDRLSTSSPAVHTRAIESAPMFANDRRRARGPRAALPAIALTTRRNQMTTTLQSIAIDTLDTVTGGVTGRWLVHHPFAAAGFLANHPGREAVFAANHPRAFGRIERIQDRWGI